MGVKFGPAGQAGNYPGRSSVEYPGWLASQGLDAFEYQCGKGVNVGEETAWAVGVAAREHGIQLSLHAPYFINLANPDPVSLKKTTNYVLAACQVADWMGAVRVTVHTGALMKRTRREALDIALISLREVIRACDGEGYGHITLCPETLGADRASRFHSHFSKIAFTPGGGEKCHLTFDQEDFGPDPVPLMRELARRGWSPTVICESAGTQARDAQEMQTLYRRFLKGPGEKEREGV